MPQEPRSVKAFNHSETSWISIVISDYATNISNSNYTLKVLATWSHNKLVKMHCFHQDVSL